MSRERGFLPKRDPLEKLPERYIKLDELLREMPIRKRDGSVGFLGLGKFGVVVKELPLIEVGEEENEEVLLGLFRDYTFVASAYLLEPCHANWLSNGSYGLGRQSLPPNIAIPLCKIAEKLSISPFMEYAQSYALYNWRKKDKEGGMEFENLELIRSFEGNDSEKGFILVHVCMVSHTGELVSAVLDNLEAAEKGKKPDLQKIVRVMQKINQEMAQMWKRSKPEDYQDFRTFIMGIKDQPMFPEGVVYEGVDPQPRQYRGESGANDSIIPTLDNLLQIRMPENPMTAILRDFRKYRPHAHREWLQLVKERAEKVSFYEYCVKEQRGEVIELLEQIQEFRQRHWNFVKEYILKYSEHPRATGGSPIATWLSNQLLTVIDMIITLDSSDAQLKQHRDLLIAEVDSFKSKFNQ